MKTLSQQYAHPVYSRVDEAREMFPAEETFGKYRAMSESLPVLILRAGLAQAVTFVISRGEDPQKQLLTDLTTVLEGTSPDQFVQECLTADLEKYMYLTRKSLLALSWFKRFTNAVLESEAS